MKRFISLYIVGWVIIYNYFIPSFVTVKTITPKCCGCPDELLPDAKGRGQQFIGSSTAPRGDSYDCHKGRFEIVVLLPNSNIHYKLHNRHILYYDKTGCNSFHVCLFDSDLLVCIFFVSSAYSFTCLLILLFLFCLFCLCVWFIFCMIVCLLCFILFLFVLLVCLLFVLFYIILSFLYLFSYFMCLFVINAWLDLFVLCLFLFVLSCFV